MTHTIHSVTQRQVHGDSDTHTRDWVTRYWQKKHTCSTHGRWWIDHAHIGNTYEPTSALPRPRPKLFLLTSTLFLIQTVKLRTVQGPTPAYGLVIRLLAQAGNTSSHRPEIVRPCHPPTSSHRPEISITGRKLP